MLYTLYLKRIIYGVIFLFIFNVSHNLLAQERIPDSTGFSGYVLAIPGVFIISNNLLAGGAPLLEASGTSQISSIFDSPDSNSIPALPFAGELNYTFGKSRTQLFFGNKFEDILRLDVAFRFGVRQEIGKAGILDANIIITPLELRFWSDPYVENENRIPTELNFPGFRIMWGQIFQTALDLTAIYREYKHEDERSGEWLVSRGRLNDNQLHLLNRDGNFYRFKALYKIKLNQHRLEPAFRYTNHNHQGDAVKNDQLTFLLDYIYLHSKMMFDIKLIYGKRKSKTIHPVYNDILRGDRYGMALAVLFPIKLFKSTGWNILVSGEIVDENTNIDFYDSKLIGFNAGIMWRHTKK